MAHDVVVVVQLIEESYVLLALVGLVPVPDLRRTVPALAMSLRTKNQDSPAVRLHGLQSLKCDGPVDLVRLVIINLKGLRDSLVRDCPEWWVHNDSIEGLARIEFCSIPHICLDALRRQILSPAHLNLIGPGIGWVSSDQEHPVTSRRIVDRAVWPDTGNSVCQIGQWGRSAVGLVPATTAAADAQSRL